MFVAGVVHDQVGDDADAPPMGFVDQPAGVVEVTVGGQDRVEVGDVVATVAQRRLVERQQPQAVHAKPLQVVELGDQTLQVADAVVIRVVETRHEDLVEHRLLVPPGVVRPATDRPRASRRDVVDAGRRASDLAGQRLFHSATPLGLGERPYRSRSGRLAQVPHPDVPESPGPGALVGQEGSLRTRYGGRPSPGPDQAS